MNVRSDANQSLVATFVTLGLAYGVWYAYSVFLVVLAEELHWSRSLVAGAFAVFALVHGLSSPPLGWLDRDRKSTRLNSSHSQISYAVSFYRKSTRLNSSHSQISYAVFCLKKKNKLLLHEFVIQFARRRLNLPERVHQRRYTSRQK